MNLKEIGTIVWLGLGLIPRLLRISFHGYKSTSSIKYTAAYVTAYIAESVSYSRIGNRFFKQRAIRIAAYLVSISTYLLRGGCKDFEIWFSMMKTQTMNSYFIEGASIACEVYKLSISRPTNFFQKQEIVKSAAYGSNICLLEEIISNQSWVGECPGFQEFIRGIVKFNLNSSDWVDQLALSKQKYEASILFTGRDGSRELPEFYHNVRNFLSRPAVNMIFQRVATLENQDFLAGDNSNLVMRPLLVLVSCDEAYFVIFITNFINSFRRNNNNLVKIILVKGAGSLSEATVAMIEKITNGDSKCTIEVQETEHNPGLVSSLERFLSAEITSEIFETDVVILDVDLSVDFCLNDYFKGSIHDISCVVNHEVSVPWARYNAGIFYFKRNRNALNVIRLNAAYSNSILSRNGGWTLDQSSLMLAIEFYISIGEFISIGSIPRAIPIRWSANTPPHLYRDRSQSKLNVLKQ
jgi:hypothetical protein